MIILEIESNDNCAELAMRVFHELSEACGVTHVRIEQKPGTPEWFTVTGWDQTNSSVPAIAQKIDDSGDGTAWLIRGGDAGLRIMREGLDMPWSIDEPTQSGEPYLVVASETDLRFKAA